MPAVSRLRRRGGCGRRGWRREYAGAGSQQSPIWPCGIAKEDFAFARLGVEPAREQGEILREVVWNGADAELSFQIGRTRNYRFCGSGIARYRAKALILNRLALAAVVSASR